jgi:transglutaminase-like putative cysteine protease
LPRQHLLGSGPELSQQVVLLIRLDNGWGVAGQRATPSGEDVPAQLGAPLRWRSLAYDRYSGFGWQAGQTEIVSYGAGEPAGAQTCEVCETSQVLQVRQEVQVVGDLGGLIYAAGQLVTVDQAYSVAYRTGDDAFGATTAATAYRADSLVALPTEAELRAAGSSYPRWVQRRYLALPAKLPKRVLALARDLTATEATPYDRAKAIETYLRTIPYNLDIPAPPVNRDVVDYFLFDLRQGYCDYYATAMVVLARAAGLPARLVIGYASGAYDAAANRYVVSAANAHSWPEIYFPGYGWIEFEPTANQAVMARPAEIRPLTPAVEIPAAEVAPLAGTGLSRWWIWGWGVSAGLAGLALAGLAWSVADAWWLAHLPPAATVERLYQRLRRYGRRLAVPTGAGDTPYEFRAALAGRLAHLAQGRRWARLLAPAAPEVAGLTDLYVQAAYSAHPPGPTDRQQAVQTWRRLRLRLWLAWGLHVILRPQAEES